MTLEAITADWEQQYGLLAPPIFRPPTYTQDTSMEEQSPEDKAFSSRKGAYLAETAKLISEVHRKSFH